jgi:hypothetical protein
VDLGGPQVNEHEQRAGAEAARLVAALQGWLRTSAPHLAPVDADGNPCSCPLCRAVVGVREADPDQVARWVESGVAVLGSAFAQASDLAGHWTSDRGWTAADLDTEPGEGDDAGSPVSPEDDTGHDVPRTRTVRRIPIHRDDTTS